VATDASVSQERIQGAQEPRHGIAGRGDEIGVSVVQFEFIELTTE
jgi:hypothetical protein